MWPFEVLGGIFWGFLNFWEGKLFEAQGELNKETLVVAYGSTLPLDTFLVIQFIAYFWIDYSKSLVISEQDNCSEKDEMVNLCVSSSRRLKLLR